MPDQRLVTIVVIAEEASEEDHQAPRTTPVRRLDEARAARSLIPTFDARPHPEPEQDDAAETLEAPSARY